MAILAITKQFGSGGGEIGSSVANLLGYEYIPLNRIFEEAAKAGMEMQRLAEKFDSHVPGLWEQIDWSFLVFAAFCERVVLDYALRNDAVVMTRGGNILLKDIPHALRIFMTAPFEARVQRIAEKEEVAEDIAVLMAKKADREMAVTIQQIYGANWKDPTEYDRVIDTSSRDWEEIACSLGDGLLEKQGDFEEEAWRMLSMRALATRVKARIMTSPGCVVPTLEIDVKDDFLVIRGVVRNLEQHKRIEEEVRNMTGDVVVEFHLSYRGSWPFRGI
ncbi:MAG: cytidylate kinase-like family protein [Syntrophus sp. (in: bacteria)]|nr:cytidylate kinase-like family protein [Syntrophus sp. (in: bacteria)]